MHKIWITQKTKVLKELYYWNEALNHKLLGQNTFVCDWGQFFLFSFYCMLSGKFVLFFKLLILAYKQLISLFIEVSKEQFFGRVNCDLCLVINLRFSQCLFLIYLKCMSKCFWIVPVHTSRELFVCFICQRMEESASTSSSDWHLGECCLRMVISHFHRSHVLYPLCLLVHIRTIILSNFVFQLTTKSAPLCM